MRVIWSKRARSDVGVIIAYIEAFDEEAAFRTAGRLRKAPDVLGDHSRLGRSIGGGVRQLSSVYPYLIRYRVRHDHIEIIAVRHGARR